MAYISEISVSYIPSYSLYGPSIPVKVLNDIGSKTIPKGRRLRIRKKRLHNVAEIRYGKCVFWMCVCVYSGLTSLSTIF